VAAAGVGCHVPLHAARVQGSHCAAGTLRVRQWSAPRVVRTTTAPRSRRPPPAQRRLLEAGVEPCAAAARAAPPGLPPLHHLDAVLGAGVVRWRPTGGPDDAAGVPGLHFPGPASRCLDSEHMQQHGISQACSWAPAAARARPPRA
jgi:hypothetical protein